jgi:Zn-dependent M28 family amino/carboxypeptidase
LSGHQENSPLKSRSSKQQRRKTAEYLVEILFENGFETKQHKYQYRNANPLLDLLLSPHSGINVYTVLEATQPSDHYVVLGAHYDSVPNSPGAGDNAAGVSVLIEVLLRLNKMEYRNINFLFVFLDQEEDDEVGSNVFAKKLIEEKTQVHSVHITDISGWDNNKNRIIGIQSPGPYLEALYRKSALSLNIELDVYGGASSDNKAFLAAGFVTTGVFGDVSEHLHKPSDTYDNVDFEYLALLTDLMTSSMRNIINETHHE